MTTIALQCVDCKWVSGQWFPKDKSKLPVWVCEEYPAPEGVPSFVVSPIPEDRKDCPEFTTESKPLFPERR